MTVWTTPVFQKGNHDCVIATIAMATEKPYDEVMAAAVKCDAYKEGEGVSSEQYILEELGFLHTYRNGVSIGDFTNAVRGFYISPEFFRAMAWGRKAIMTVPSLNKEGGWHSVFWDGDRLFDPNPPTRNRYTSWEELKPDSMILFNETHEADKMIRTIRNSEMLVESHKGFRKDLINLPVVPSDETIIVLQQAAKMMDWTHTAGKQLQAEVNGVPENFEAECAAGLWVVIRDAIESYATNLKKDKP